MMEGPCWSCLKRNRQTRTARRGWEHRRRSYGKAKLLRNHARAGTQQQNRRHRDVRPATHAASLFLIPRAAWYAKVDSAIVVFLLCLAQVQFGQSYLMSNTGRKIK